MPPTYIEFMILYAILFFNIMTYIHLLRTALRMKEQELYGVLRKLSSRDRTAFRRYLQAVESKQDKALGVYFDVIIASLHHPKLVDDAWISNQLPHEQRSLYLLRNRLMNHLERFLVSQQVPDTETHFLLQLAERYLNMGLLVRFERTMRKLEKRLDAMPENASVRLVANFRAKLLRMHRKAESEQFDRQELGAVLDSLDRLYVMEKLRLSAEMLTRQRLAEVEQHVPLLDTIIGAKESRGVSSLFRLYEHLVQMQRQPYDMAILDTYLEELGKRAAELDQHTLRDMFAQALNACTRLTNTGRTAYFQRYLDLLNQMESFGILLQAGEMESWMFMNGLRSCLRIGKTEQAQAMLDVHGKHLRTDVGPRFTALGQAMIWFEASDYERVLQLIQQTRFEEVRHTVLMRTVGVKALAEIAWQSGKDSPKGGAKEPPLHALLAEMEAFTKYMRYHQQELDQVRTARTLEMLQVIRKWWNLPLYERRESNPLIDRVKGAAVMEKSWLIGYLSRDYRQIATSD